MSGRLHMRGLMLLAVGALLIIPQGAQAAPASISRDQIIAIAKTGLGCPYLWGGTCWDPNNKKWKGADCSGYVTKCWQIPSPSATTACLPHYYTTSTFKSNTNHANWYSISRNDLIKADALVYNQSGKGHIVLYYSGDKWGYANVYEAKGTSWGIVYGSKNCDSKYVARRRRNVTSTTTPTYPLMTITTSVVSIKGQARDLCTRGKSTGIFDWWTGQKAEVRVDVKNSGKEVAKNVDVGLWAEQPYIKVDHWNIYTDYKHPGTFTLNDTDSLQKIPHANPSQTFKLWLSAISPGETKRVKLLVRAVKFSYGVVDHPDVRAWVSHVDNYYEKSSFYAKPNNVKGYQKQNGGDLRHYTQTDVLSKEVCDKQDNNCDGQTDEGGVCSQKDGGGQPKPDSSKGLDASWPGQDSLGYWDSSGTSDASQDGLVAEENRSSLRGGCNCSVLARAGKDREGVPYLPLLALCLLAGLGLRRWS